MSAKRIAVIGGGPIGLEAALEARRRGFEVKVYEAGRVGEHMSRFGHVTLFTPFGMNSTAAGRARLRETGVPLPADDALLRASEFVERYLEPLAALPELRGSIEVGARVTGLAREGLTKSRGIVAVGDRSRDGRAFLIRVETADATRFDRADFVLDASGVYATPNAAGPGGLLAPGEDRLGDRLERHLPSILAGARRRYEGRSILLIGDGHSAATALVELDELSRSGATLEVHWAHRDREPEGVYCELKDDALPARRELTARANAIARSATWLKRHPGVSVVSYGTGPAGRVRATLRAPSAEERAIDVDRVLALVGYRPDIELYRELQIHLCYASEAPMKLASAILTAAVADPEKAGDCLSQVSHGAEALESPEPDFYILGAKSYGRNASFVLPIGHQQVLDALTALASKGPSFPVAPLHAGRTMS